MAVVKIFDCNGVKTIELMGNANDQPYDPIEEEDLSASEDLEAEE